MLFWRKKQTPPPSPAPLEANLKSLLTATLRAVSLNDNADWSGNDGSEKFMRDYLERNAQEAASDKSRPLFHFARQGRTIFPFFTSSERVSEWLAKNPFAESGVTAITVIGMQGATAFRKFADAPPSVVVVLDLMSDAERILTHEELQALARS